MLYIPQPERVYRLRDSLTGGAAAAAWKAAEDFIAQDLKPWSYYAGVGVGGAAAATGIPGAAAVLYAVGSSIDLYVLKSPHGSNVKIFLDGVLVAEPALYAADLVWDILNIVLDNVEHMYQIVVQNVSPAPGNNTGIAWLALAGVRAYGQTANIWEVGMAVTNTVSIIVRDAAGNRAALNAHFPASVTLADIQTWVTAAATRLDAVTDGVIERAFVEMALNLPGGLKSTPGSQRVYEGGLFTFDAANTDYSYSARVPAIQNALLSGNNINTSNSDVSNLVGAYVSGVSGVAPTDRYGNDLSGLTSAKVSVRKLAR